MNSTRKYKLSRSYPKAYFATGKVERDTDAIYAQNGFKIIHVPRIPIKGFGVVELFISMLYLFRLKKGCEIHLIVPFTSVEKWRLRIVFIWMMKVIRLRANKIVFLVIDVDYLRLERINREQEISILKLADELIVHTHAMVDELKSQGLRKPMKILTLFDYLTQSNNVFREANIYSCVFAGSLQKSKFINQLVNNESWNLSTYFYGRGCPQIPENSNFHYEGKFEADDISQIKGAWGLVWDGDSVATCDSSLFGNYLRFNSSHKISLYLVIEKPIIVWSKSSLRNFVIENGIGIEVDSLLEIPSLLPKITEGEYSNFVTNVKKISKKLRSGGYLTSCLLESQV
jgi:hypothetical protein